MTETHVSADIKKILGRLGYQEAAVTDISDLLEVVLTEIGFPAVKRRIDAGQPEPGVLASSLKDLMQGLEKLGYFRPDIPRPLLKLLVTGLNHANEDIFAVLDMGPLTETEKKNEKEFLASCAAITQLGYILVHLLVPGVKAASAGPHVFLLLDSFDPALFVDFSLDSILEIDLNKTYQQEEDNYSLKENPELDQETIQFLSQYYPVFHVTSGVGLSHNIHNNLGITYDKVGRHQEAMEELSRAMQLDPGYIDVKTNAAVTYFHMDRCDEAVQSLQEVIRSKPDNVQAHCNLGNIYTHQGRYDEAIREIKKAIDLDADYAPAHNSLGTIHVEQKNDQAAIEEFQAAIELDPDYLLAHTNLGALYQDSGRYEDAINEFKAALNLDPEHVESNYRIGMTYCSKGSYDRAVQPLVLAVYHRPELLESVPDKIKLKVSRGISRLKGI